MRRAVRIRARGPRGTHGLVEMVREQVAELSAAMDGLSASVDEMKSRVTAAVDGVQAQTAKLATRVGALGATLRAMARDVDDHEKRISALEARK